MLFKHVCFIVFFLFVASGCTSFRGMPSHGGGKRFDEEQRLIAAATYRALNQMDVEKLKGKKVRIASEFMTTYGSGNATYGGLQSIGFSPSFQDQLVDYLGPTSGRTGEQRAITTSTASFSYRPDMSFYTSQANTDRDAAYFISCLEMKLRHSGVTTVLKDEEVTLFILLDVLGTNLSRKDRLVQHTDFLDAACEFTYYAMDTKTGTLLFESRRSGGIARYEENTTLFIGRSSIKRSVESTSPLLDMPDFHTRKEEIPVEEKPVANEIQKPADPPATGREPRASRNRPYWQYSIGFLQRLMTFQKPAPSPGENEQNPLAQPAQSGANEESETARRSQQLKDLEARAMQLIQSGESNKASEVVQQIRAIDPTADELKKITVLQGPQQ